jgi:hypothetical protein
LLDFLPCPCSLLFTCFVRARSSHLRWTHFIRSLLASKLASRILPPQQTELQDFAFAEGSFELVADPRLGCDLRQINECQALGGAHSPRPWPEGWRRSEATSGLPGDCAGTHRRQGVGSILTWLGLCYGSVPSQTHLQSFTTLFRLSNGVVVLSD